MAKLTNDEKIIKQNPGLSAYELLAKGLSPEAYTELVAKEQASMEANKVGPVKVAPAVTETPIKNGPAKATVIQTPSKAVPKLSDIPHNAYSDMAWLVGPDGKQTLMTKEAAERCSRKFKGHSVKY